MKIVILVLVVVLGALVLGGLPKLVQESEIKNCVTSLSANNGNEMIAMMDKSAYCRCLSNEAKQQGGMKGEVLAKCMETHVRPHTDKYCTTTLATQLQSQKMAINCGCFYQQTVMQAQLTFQSGGVLTPEQQQKASADVMQNCVTTTQ